MSALPESHRPLSGVAVLLLGLLLTVQVLFMEPSLGTLLTMWLLGAAVLWLFAAHRRLPVLLPTFGVPSEEGIPFEVERAVAFFEQLHREASTSARVCTRWACSSCQRRFRPGFPG